jgi:hypothetical protein
MIMSSQRLIVFVLALAAALGAYAFWWAGKAEAVAQHYNEQFFALFPQGTRVSYLVRDSGGFPFRIYHTLSQVAVSVPGYGKMSLEEVDLIHEPWTDNHMIIRFNGTVVRTDVDGGLVWSLTAEKNLASLVGGASGKQSFDQDMREIVLERRENSMKIPVLQYHAKTTGWFGDESTEAVSITETEGAPSLF